MSVAEIQGMRSVPVMAPLVSIIIPTCKAGYLEGCLRSLQERTDLSMVEVIVVANGCPDTKVRECVRSLGKPFALVEYTQRLGYTRAVNEGLKVATGEYVLLLNDDTVLLYQPKNLWIDMLLAPFRGNHKVGISGPAKFWWKCGETRRRAIAFWCAMIRRSLFQTLGALDEIFSPGMGEDADFSIKAETAGYALVQVPKDGEEEFGKGIPNTGFPIWHQGSGTFSDKDYSEVRKRNHQVLEDRYGKGGRLEEIYSICLNHPSDTNALFPTLRKYATGCKHVTEFGTRGVFTTWAFLAAKPERLVTYDVEYGFNVSNIEEAASEAKKVGISFQFFHQDVLEANIEETDLLFIDTKHTYAQLLAELRLHAARVRKFILVHDVVSFGTRGEDGGPGEVAALDKFLAEFDAEWSVIEHIEESNGLAVLGRRSVSALAPSSVAPYVSIVIPTVDHFEDALQKCLEAVLAYTPLDGVEIIVVANGTPRRALDWLRTQPVRVLEYPARLGYIRAVNAGISAARGAFVVLLDDDSFLLPQARRAWLSALLAPLEADPQMGAASPLSKTYDDGLGHVLHSGCTAYRRAALLAVGSFDEAFDPGYMGDEDLAIRLRKAGWKLSPVPPGHTNKYVDGTFQMAFPLLHTGTVNTMPKNTTDLPRVARNRELLYQRHAPRPRVSIIIPTYNHLDDLLKPNLTTLATFTDLVAENVEVIVVANGCTDGTEDYVRSLGEPFKIVSFPNPLGYTRATNEGIKVSKGEFVVFYNNDNELQPQEKGRWLHQLLAPFEGNEQMGITGPLQLHDDYADQDVIIGFCLCIRRKVLDACGGLLDEAYSPGGGEDIHLCCTARKLGYVVRQVPHEGKLGFGHTNEGDFMIFHKNNQTFRDIEEYTRWYVKRNGFLNLKRWNRNVRLNLGSGGVVVKGYLSVDLHDRRADIIADVTSLGLADNCVAEFLAIHLFEHLNPYKVLDVLKDWFRMLKPGGRLVMEMPDLIQLCTKFAASKETGERYNYANGIYGAVNTTETSADDPASITSPHLFGWWEDALRDHLTNAGFVDIEFGEEQFPHPPAGCNLRVVAHKPGERVRSMRDLWQPPDVQVPFGDDTTYRMAMDFLADCPEVEDWGCGTAYAKNFVRPGQKYTGVDGSSCKFVDRLADLQEYRSNTDGILLRHILEHNENWRDVLRNALGSARRKLAIIFSTPFTPETKSIGREFNDIPLISFKREDIEYALKDGDAVFDLLWQTVKSATCFGGEQLLFISRRP